MRRQRVAACLKGLRVFVLGLVFPPPCNSERKYSTDELGSSVLTTTAIREAGFLIQLFSFVDENNAALFLL